METKIERQERMATALMLTLRRKKVIQEIAEYQSLYRQLWHYLPKQKSPDPLWKLDLGTLK
jgi:hypothetical protein